MKIKIYCDRSFHPKSIEHVEMLIPFWGKNGEDRCPLQSGRYERLIAMAPEFFELSELDAADLCVLSFPWKYTIGNAEVLGVAKHFLERCADAGRPVVIFFAGPYEDQIPDDRSTLVFRTSLYRSRRKGNEFALACWGQDLLVKFDGGRLNPRCKSGRPTVGFCGYAPPLGLPWGWKRLKESLRTACAASGLLAYAPNHTGHSLRTRALRTLSRCQSLQTNFLFRENLAFSGVGTVMGDTPPEQALNFQREFYDNIVNSDYVLCARGYGNNSIRLYEALSCGRIPVFIDSDCVLPYDFLIDWKKYCVWVTENELPFLGEKIADFHARLSNASFVELQYSCRKLWEDWLSSGKARCKPRGQCSQLIKKNNRLPNLSSHAETVAEKPSPSQHTVDFFHLSFDLMDSFIQQRA
jgi:hypothetical protein